MFSRAALLLALMLVLPAAWAISPAQQSAIERLGELNGIALQCRYQDETKRMKHAMVASSPKLRALGQFFEDSTQRAFLAFMEQRRTCPPAALFTLQVDQAIAGLEQAFAGTGETPQ